jgi:hypothetical protein
MQVRFYGHAKCINFRHLRLVGELMVPEHFIIDVPGNLELYTQLCPETVYSGIPKIDKNSPQILTL